MDCGSLAIAVGTRFKKHLGRDTGDSGGYLQEQATGYDGRGE